MVFVLLLSPPSTFPRFIRAAARVSALFLFTDGNVPLYGSTAFCVSIHLSMDVLTEFLVPCGASLASPEPWSGPHVAPDLGGLSPLSQGLGPSWKSSRPRLPGGRLLLGKVLPPYYPWLVLDSILSFLRLLPRLRSPQAQGALMPVEEKQRRGIPTSLAFEGGGMPEAVVAPRGAPQPSPLSGLAPDPAM